MPVSNSVSGDLCLNLSKIFPNSVLAPVFITNAFAVPLTINVPIKSEFALSLSGVSFGNIYWIFLYRISSHQLMLPHLQKDLLIR